ncbi:FAD-dependent oxidoreductase [Homoserinimonas sp. OAct 916]|uniref:FAD-dependent oxidoreductase n=1 Tax=Homoserinimonas sp. OAct 916 TaxID=2211450 RepID=UPI000DBE8B05|nr:FAD-dependent oxidoreductase [Homoserinimonas sp. OAct 916]
MQIRKNSKSERFRSFIAPRPRPNDRLLRSLGCAIDANPGLIAVDHFGQTSVHGVWAAGNVVTPSAQVITAAGAGSASAIAINRWLLQKDLDVASAARP